jgi:tyrosyl-tRNA synthetase
MTSNYSFYQYLFNQPDDAIKSLLYRFTLLPRKEIDEIMKLHEKEPFKRIGQRKLAYVITKDVRGEKGLKEALEVSRILFSGSLEESSVDLQKKVVDHIPNKVFLKGKKEIGIIDVLIQSNICKSSSEARKLIEQKAIKYDNQIITDIKYVFKNSNKIEFIKKGVRIYIVLDWKK